MLANRCSLPTQLSSIQHPSATPSKNLEPIHCPPLCHVIPSYASSDTLVLNGGCRVRWGCRVSHSWSLLGGDSSCIACSAEASAISALLRALVSRVDASASPAGVSLITSNSLDANAVEALLLVSSWTSLIMSSNLDGLCSTSCCCCPLSARCPL